MNRYSLLPVFLLIACSEGFTQWVWQNPLPQGNALYCVRMLNSSTGYAAGDFGTILKTTNNGINWTHQVTGVNIMLRSLYFTDIIQVTL